MWSIALLVNTSTWTEIKDNWRLICLVFWNYGTTGNEDVERHSTVLLTRIKQISSDQNTVAVIKYSQSRPIITRDAYDFDNDSGNAADEEEHNHSNKNIAISKTTNKHVNSRVSQAKNKRLVDNELLFFDDLFFVLLRWWMKKKNLTKQIALSKVIYKQFLMIAVERIIRADIPLPR